MEKRKNAVFISTYILMTNQINLQKVGIEVVTSLLISQALC